MSRTGLKWSVMICVAAAGLLASGCGYTARDQYRKGIKTVCVPMVVRGPEVYTRDVEMRLTESLVKRLEQDTPYKVTKENRADTKLAITLNRISRSAGSVNTDTGVPRERRITYNVSVEWKDLRTGKTLVNRKEFTCTTTYRPSQSPNETFFQGSEALNDKISRRIVELLEEDWSEEF